jgi:predicted TPR repeat methyltransferase/cytochrome c-type biogenesis protein CcmH/NrfG
MPQDTFQIAQEHHRAGRLRQAEAGYRQRLAEDPADADANHWLGVLLTQAGLAADALPHLAMAASTQPEDPAFQHNLGRALLDLGLVREAVLPLERAFELEPARPAPLLLLSRAYLGRNAEGDADRAVEALQRAIEEGADRQRLHHELGVALLAADRPADAMDELRKAVAAEPMNASACYHLAVACRGADRTHEIRRWLMRAVEADPSHFRAWHGLGMLDVEAGNLEVAISLFRRSIRARNDFAPAYRGLAACLDRLGRVDESIAALEQAAKAERGELTERPKAAPAVESAVAALEARAVPQGVAAILHEALAGLTSLPAPAKPAAAGVASLFDRYADDFDQHLRGTLNYRAPELVCDALKSALPVDRVAAGGLEILDLGCGTGLCGPLLRPLAGRLEGIDLSPAMVAKARERKVYDRVEVAELVEAMERSPARWDALVAADVLVYLGDLAPTYEAAAKALRPGGVFVFTVEAGDGERYRMGRRSRRYQHAESYLRHLAGIYGFTISSLTRDTLRTDAGQPVAGFIAVLRM